MLLLQVGALCALWLLSDRLRSWLELPLPTSLLGLLILAAGLFAGVVKSTWLRHGTNWLLGDMTLFFIPAILVVIQYPDLIRHEGLRILAVICMSTALVMAVTAVAVDQVYRLELKLARRRHRTRHA